MAPCTVLLAVLAASEPLVLSGHADGEALGHRMTFLEDPGGRLTLEDVEGRRHAFRGWADDDLLFGFTHSAFWLRLVLRGETAGPYLLEFTYPLHDEVLLYSRAPDGSRRVQRSGMSLPFAQRTIPDPHLLFPIFVPAAADVELLIRVHSSSAMQLGARLWDPDAFARHQHHDRFWKGLLYGILVAAVLYNLSVWWSVRDLSHLAFVAFVLIVVIVEATLDGLAYEYLWPGQPWWARHAPPFLIALTGLTGVFLTRSVLDTAHNAPLHHRFLGGLMGLSTSAALGALFVDYQWSVRWSLTTMVVALVATVATSWACRARQVFFAGMFLMAQSVILVVALGAMLQPFVSFPGSWLVDHGMQAGAGVMAILYTFSLGRRLSAAERAALSAQEQLNRSLEDLVRRRTTELEEKNRELADLNARKDALVATVSHDFRSPLAAIRQNVQTLLRDLRVMDPADARNFLEGIGRQETRLTSMCTKLLDLARLRGGALERRPVDLGQLARGIVDGFGLRAREAGVQVAVEVAAGVPPVPGEPDRLEQLLQNLVDNALKFTPRGGRVDVTLQPHKGGVRLTVADTGCGVPARHVPRLFDPFFQVPSQNHAGQGSGLGLAIVSAVATAHGGRVDVQSEEGRGTRFTVELPAA